MRDDDSNWFSKWEDELPSPEELTPLSQTLITPDLAMAFNIPNPHQNAHAPPLPPPPPQQSSQPNSSTEFDSLDLSAAAADEPARTLKRPRLVWTPQLHKRFVDAVAHLGIKNAVPKTIMQLMSVDGLTRENVASHLQKFRLYLKRMQGISAGDTATDHLFASSPVPPHFVHPGRAAAGGSDRFMPFSPMAAPKHHHHHQQMVGQQPPSHHLMQQQFRQLGGSHPHGNGQFDQPFMKQPQHQAQRIGTPVHGSYSVGPPAYPTNIEPVNRRKVLTLFPTGDDLKII